MNLWQFLAENPGYGIAGIVLAGLTLFTLWSIFRKPLKGELDKEAEQNKAETELNKSRLELISYIKDNRGEIKNAQQSLGLTDPRQNRHSESVPDYLPDDF
jgi:cbb3-type cytochrome oxidase subunit 3